MIKTLQKHALVMVALLLPITQTASLQAMPTSTKVLIGTTAASVGATLIYGYIIYTKETEKLGKTPTFSQYINFLKTLVTKSPTRNKITKLYPALTAFVALNATLLIGTTGKLIKDRYADKAEKKKQEEDKKKQEEDKKKKDDEDKRNAALLAPATKPLAQLTAKERGDRKEAQRKAKGEEALSYDPKKASKEVDLDFERPEAGWTEEEKSPEYTASKKKLFKLAATDAADWEKQMNATADADGVPAVKIPTEQDIKTYLLDDGWLQEEIDKNFNELNIPGNESAKKEFIQEKTYFLYKNNPEFRASLDANENAYQAKLLKYVETERARKSTEEYKKKSAEIRERAQEIRKQLEETRKKLNPLYPTKEKNKKHLRSLKSEKKHNGFDVPVEVLEPKTKKAI